MTKKRRPKKADPPPRLLIVAGVLGLAALVLLLKGGGEDPVSSTGSGELPAAQLQAALSAGRPTLAFIHSTTCDQCIEMTGIVAEVHPEFEDTIILVDVDVYDERNAALLNEMRIQYIPTLILFDRSGNSRAAVGVMEAGVLREALAALAEGA